MHGNRSRTCCAAAGRVAVRHPRRVTHLVTAAGYAAPRPSLALRLEVWAALVARAGDGGEGDGGGRSWS